MAFQTPYSRELLPDEPGGGRRIVETAGYIPAKRQITDMINAGARLDAYRKGMYDYEHPSDDDGYTIDPTRGPNFDLADAYRLGKEAGARLDKATKEAVATAEAESKAKAEAAAEATKAKIIAEYKASLEAKNE